jgi:hypothetical protein
MTWTSRVLATALVAAATGACAADPGIAPAMLSLSYVAGDFSFDGPETAPAGLTTLTMKNAGAELHHMAVIRLNDGHTMADFFATLAEGPGPLPEWAREVGGPSAAGPGGEISSTLMLEEGRYAIVCWIPSPTDGVPHMMKGMARELTVGAGPRQAAADLPTIDLVLTDYAFTFSQPLRAGVQTLRVRTDAPQRQAHEAVFVRLHGDNTAADFLHWVEAPSGPPPGEPIGGIAGLSPGEWNDLTLDLSPGRYGIICFLPDIGNGAPHAMHGMLMEFTID